MKKLPDYIGIAAALYVIATYKRLAKITAQSMASVNRILKEVWSQPAIEAQLMSNTFLMDMLEFKHDINRNAYGDPPRPVASSLPGGWGEKYRWRKARKARRRQQRRRRVMRAFLLAPPTERDF